MHSSDNGAGAASALGAVAPVEGTKVEEAKPAEEPPRRKKSRFAPPPTGAGTFGASLQFDKRICHGAFAGCMRFVPAKGCVLAEEM